MSNTRTAGAAGVSVSWNWTKEETCLPDVDTLPFTSVLELMVLAVWLWEGFFFFHQSEGTEHSHWPCLLPSVGPTRTFCVAQRPQIHWIGTCGPKQRDAHECVIVRPWWIAVLLGNHSLFPEEKVVQEGNRTVLRPFLPLQGPTTKPLSFCSLICNSDKQT